MLTHKDNCLTLVPVGGLGNRLLALFSAIHLVSVKKFDSLRILWAASSSECNIAFRDLGVINIPHEIVTYNNYGGPLPPPHISPGKMHEFFPYFDGQIIVSCTDFSNFLTHCDGIHPTAINLPHTNLFQFTDKHYQKADTIDVNGRTGIHCRRTDWHHAIEIEEGYMKFAASDNKIISYINSTDDKLFIATDSPYALARLRTATGDRLIHYPKQHYPTNPVNHKAAQRNTACVSDAIIDIILLSRCTQIIADSASSFSTVSGILGNIPKTVI